MRVPICLVARTVEKRPAFGPGCAGIASSLWRALKSCAARSVTGNSWTDWSSTGVAKEKIMIFLKADPDGHGSVQDRVTAEMTTELMKVMGIQGRQTPEEVKRIRNSVDKDSK